MALKVLKPIFKLLTNEEPTTNDPKLESYKFINPVQNPDSNKTISKFSSNRLIYFQNPNT